MALPRCPIDAIVSVERRPQRRAGAVQPRLGGPDREIERVRRFGERQAQVVMQDDKRALVRGEPLESPAKRVPLGDEDRRVRHGRLVELCQLDLDDATAHLAQLVDASADEEAPQPGGEPLRVTERWQVTPGSDERFLDRIPRMLAVSDDQAGRGVEPADRVGRQPGERFAIASACPNHEIEVHPIRSLPPLPAYESRRGRSSEGSRIPNSDGFSIPQSSKAVDWRAYSFPVTLPSPPAPPGPPTQRPSEPPAPPPQRGLPGRIWWIIFIVLLGWNVIALLGLGAATSVEVPYSAFLAQARAGNIDAVTFNGQELDGTFRQPIAWPQPSAAPASAAPNASGADASAAPVATQPAQTYSSFTTIVPPDGDPALLPLLESHGVTISAKNVGGGSFLLDLIVGILPVVLIVGVILYLGRQMQRSQAGIFGFGGSRARLYDAEQPSVTFADVAGEDQAKTELAEVVDFLKMPDRYRRLGARLPRGVLLIGPPGTGKTLLARAVAGEAHVPFFSISASEFVELFVGVGASRVRDLFTKAKAAAPSIVFVDEIDAVGRQRGAGLGGGNDEREQTLNQLLVEMDGFDAATNVIVIAATNRPDVLDPALLRPGRFDRQVTVGFPDRVGREAILRIHTKNLPLAPNVDLGTIARATPGFSGADLANLANEAALRAARANRDKVGPEEFEEALDTLILGTRQAGLTNEEERRTVAYHEGGHAIVARLTPGADPVQKVTIVPHGQALGVTEQRPMDDRRNYPRDYLLGRLAVSLGGRAAEEVVFGQPTTGAESDLKQATQLARRMVGLWGMSEELGPVSYGVGETQPFLGRELAAPKEFAEATAARIDEAVAELISEAHEQARAILGRERKALDALAAELVAHEMVTAARIDELLKEAGAKLPPVVEGPGTPPRVETAPGAAKPRAAATRAAKRPQR